MDKRKHTQKNKIKKKRLSVKSPNKLGVDNRKKLILAFAIICVAMLILIGRLIYINIKSGDDYKKQVLSQQNYNSQVLAFKRGDIVDCNGVVLATSEKVYNLIIDPYVLLKSIVREKGDCLEPTLQVLEKYFGSEIFDGEGIRDDLKSIDDLRKLIEDNPDNHYIVLEQKLEFEIVQAYKDFMVSDDKEDKKTSNYVKGIWFEEEYVRKYPYGSLAADLIGFTNGKDEGLWGVEKYYNDMLNGTEGRSYSYVNDNGDLISSTIPAENGKTIKLSIDVNVQRLVEEEINAFNEQIGSKNTAVVVMDPNNGEVLAMASYPTFDLNNPHDTSALEKVHIDSTIASLPEDEQQAALFNTLWRNFAVSDLFEPGSTVKTMTLAAALDEGLVDLDETFYCDGGEQFRDGYGSQRIKCNAVHYTITLEEALSKSCNDALMQIGKRIGSEKLIEYLKNFGFSEPTGIDLPGEQQPILYKSENMSEFDLATNSFGQNYNINAMHVISAYSSAVNGGSYYKPHVMKEILTASGNTVEVNEKELVRTTVSQETSQWLKMALLETVETGTGRDAAVEGYKVGGKTGTAEKHPREENKHLVSFISSVPMTLKTDPKMVVYVIIDEVQSGPRASSTVPAKLNKRITEKLLKYMQIFPEKEVVEEENQTPNEYWKENDPEPIKENESETLESQSDQETQESVESTESSIKEEVDKVE